MRLVFADTFYFLALLLTIAVLASSATALTQSVSKGPASQERRQPQVKAAPAEKAAQNNQPIKPAKQNKEAEPVPDHVSGVVKAVSVQQRSLVVSHRDGETAFDVA